MDLYTIIENTNEAIRTLVEEEMTEVKPEVVGLDNRSAVRMWVDDDYVIVKKHNDRTLQYYGGFEYVDKDCRRVIGDYVIYDNDDSRVDDCILQWRYSRERS